MLRQSLMALTVASLSSFVIVPTLSNAANAEPIAIGKNHGKAHLHKKFHGKRYYGKKFHGKKFNGKRFNRSYNRGFKRGFRHGRGFGYNRGFRGHHRRNNVFIGFGNGYYGNRFGGFGHFGGFGGFYGRNYGGFVYGGNPYIHAGNIWHNRVRYHHIDRRYDYYPPNAGYYANGTSSGRQVAGTILGGVLGGVIGSEIDGGSNRTAGIIIGSALGAALGYQVARDLDENDRYYNDSYYDSFDERNSVRVVERDDVVRRRNGDDAFDADGNYRAESEDYQPPREVRKCIRYQYRGGDYQCTKWTVEYDYGDE